MRYIHKQKGADEMYKTWHSLNEYMFIYMYSDGGNIVSGEKMYGIKRGAIAMVAPGKYHYTMPSVPEKYERSKLFLTKDEANRFFSLFDFFEFSEGALIYAALPEYEIVGAERVFDSLNDITDAKKYESAVLVSSLCSLTMLLDKYASDKEQGQSDGISLAVKHINENIKRSIGIDEIALVAKMSKYHFCRTFKKTTGLTVMEYIFKTRVMLAKNMLILSDKSVLEISEECAFSGVSYFCRVFKEETGMSPLKYRKKNKKQA